MNVTEHKRAKEKVYACKRKHIERDRERDRETERERERKREREKERG